MAVFVQKGVDPYKISYAQYRAAIMQKVDDMYLDDSPIIKAVALSESFCRQTSELLKDRKFGRLFTEPEFDEEREQFITERLLELKPDVHIAGAAHLYDGPSKSLSVAPLSQRVKEMVTGRIYLCEVGQNPILS